MNEGKPGGENEMLRNAKTRTRRIRFCPPEHMNMLSGRTRASHQGGQGRVTRENENVCSGRCIGGVRSKESEPSVGFALLSSCYS